MKEKIDNNPRSLKWEQNGELAHNDLTELIERLKKIIEQLFGVILMKK